jgi:outer membrane receptor protein involved in Fe transport
VTGALAVTASGRFNHAEIRLQDRIGTALNGDNLYSRFNPAVGATYKLAPWATTYAGYSEANRAFAVGTSVAGRPPHRSGRAGFPHPAPTSGV